MSDNYNNYKDYMKSLEENITEKNNAVKTDYKSSKNKHIKKKSKRYRVIKIKYTFVLVSFLIIIGIVVGIVSCTKHKKPKIKNDYISGITNTQKTEEIEAKIKFVNDENAQEIPSDNDAKSGIIVNIDDMKIVAERNSNKKEYPASTTKIMTLLTAVENLDDFDKTFTMTNELRDRLFTDEASVAGFEVGESVGIYDLLYATILPSGADAAIGLATVVAGSEENFVKLMNKKVNELGLKNTHFTNVTGLYDKNHYTSAYDMAVILKATIDNDVCKKVLSTMEYKTKATSFHPNGINLVSTLFHYILGTEPEVSTIYGGKTGFVDESGYCIASFGNNNTTLNEYIVVTLGNSARSPAISGQVDLYKQFVK